MIHLLSSFIGQESYLYGKYASYDGKLFYKGYEIAFLFNDKIIMRDDIHYFPIILLLTYIFHKDVCEVPVSHWSDIISCSDLLDLFVLYNRK